MDEHLCLLGIAACGVALGIAGLLTGHDGILAQSIVSLLLVIGGYTVGRARNP